jgi:hypothetical protein
MNTDAFTPRHWWFLILILLFFNIVCFGCSFVVLMARS